MLSGGQIQCSSVQKAGLQSQTYSKMYRAQKVLCSKTFVIKSEDLDFKNLNEVVLSENCLGFFLIEEPNAQKHNEFSLRQA